MFFICIFITNVLINFWIGLDLLDLLYIYIYIHININFAIYRTHLSTCINVIKHLLLSFHFYIYHCYNQYFLIDEELHVFKNLFILKSVTLCYIFSNSKLTYLHLLMYNNNRYNNNNFISCNKTIMWIKFEKKYIKRLKHNCN